MLRWKLHRSCWLRVLPVWRKQYCTMWDPQTPRKYAFLPCGHLDFESAVVLSLPQWGCNNATEAIVNLNRSYRIQTCTRSWRAFLERFGLRWAHPYARTEAKYTGIMPVLFIFKYDATTICADGGELLCCSWQKYSASVPEARAHRTLPKMSTYLCGTWGLVMRPPGYLRSVAFETAPGLHCWIDLRPG